MVGVFSGVDPVCPDGEDEKRVPAIDNDRANDDRAIPDEPAKTGTGVLFGEEREGDDQNKSDDAQNKAHLCRHRDAD